MGSISRRVFCFVLLLVGVTAPLQEVHASPVTFVGIAVDEDGKPFDKGQVWIRAWCTDGVGTEEGELAYVLNGKDGRFRITFDTESCRVPWRVRLTYKRVSGGTDYPPKGVLYEVYKDIGTFPPPKTD